MRSASGPIRHALSHRLIIKSCRRVYSSIDPGDPLKPPKDMPLISDGVASSARKTGQQFDGFTRKREPPPPAGKRPSKPLFTEKPLFPPPSSVLANPLQEQSDIFPDLRGCLVPAGSNQMDLNDPNTFPYPLDAAQLGEIRSVMQGFISSCKNSHKMTLPRAVTLTYAESMGDGMMEAVALGLARDSGADCFTFHARDFGGLLDGCAKQWYGRPYFTQSKNEKDVVRVEEDDLELADLEDGSEQRSQMWLSQYLKKQPVKKSPNMEARIKETVNLYSILTFLSQCMDKTAVSTTRIIHLSGFASSLANSLHRSHILKFAQEANSAGRTCIILISENNPKVDADEAASPNAGIPLGLASFNLVKGRCERQAEIPNTPEYDANWLLDRTALGGLKLFLVPPKDPAMKAQLQSLLEKDQQERVGAFNRRRMSDVLDQLGIPQEVDSTVNVDMKSPLLLSEAIYLAYMAAGASSNTHVVSPAALQQALEQYTETRALHKAHFAPSSAQLQRTTKLDTKSMNKYEKRLLPCIVTADMVKTRFEDIGSHERVKRNLYELITLPLERPELFASGILREAVSGILLFGPPGTGKTMLARAVAAQSKSNFIAVNSSNIYDMYVGEGEKNVKALFRLARRLSPCIVFVDEVDAMLDARSNAQGKASRVEILNEFMAEWDGLLSSSGSNADARVMVLAATNRPFALDDAVLRRLPRRILVDLPEAPARLQILKLLLKSDRIDPALDLHLLREMTQNYSGSDLKNLCIAAAMSALRRSLTSNETASISMVDFEAAIQDVPASISDAMDTLVELRKWDQTFGEGRRRGSSRSLGFT